MPGSRLAALLLAAASVVAAVLLSLVACHREDAAPAPAPRPLRVANFSGPLSLDPHFKNEVATFSALANVYDGLVGFDRQLRLQPALAVSWENPSDLTWRFHLRKGVTFHDGRPLTATDVVASLERVRRHPRSGLANYLLSVESVRELDAFTVELRTSRPSPVLLNKLCFVLIVPRDAPAEILHPVGTGPYRFVSRDADGTLHLRGNEAYWQGRPPEDAVELIALPDPQQRLQRLLAGEIDLISELETDDVAEVASTPHYKVLSAEGLLVHFLALRVDTPPFDDPRVRRAVDLALDREALVATHLLGHGEPAGQMVGRQVFGYAPDLPLPRRDVPAARALLVAAGLPDGLDVDLEMREGRDADAVVAQLAEVGIRARQVKRPWSEMYQRLQDGAVPFYYGGVLSGSADASDVLDSKVHSRDKSLGYGDSNYNGISDPELDRMIEASSTTMDMLQRRSLLQSVMRRLAEQLPLVPLYAPYSLFGVRDDVEWEPRRDGMVRCFEVRRRPRPAAAAEEG